MYKFQDLRRVRGPSRDSRPLEAVNIDGHWLDDELSCFETLNADGRSNFKRSINAQELTGDGSLYLSSRIPSKELKINFYWKTKSIDDYNQKLQHIKRILYKPQVKIRFLDEMNFYYVGSVTEFTLEKVTLTTKGSITFMCSDPFKYSDAKTIESFDNEITISDPELIYPTKPKKITIIPNKDGSGVEVTNKNTGKKLMANLSFSNGKLITFDFDKLDFQVDRVSHLMDLDLASNFDDFLIKDGDIISINVSGSHKIEYEVKQL